MPLSTLMARAESKCELCSSAADLSAYDVGPQGGANVETSALLCALCQGQIDGTETPDSQHWRCLNESMWSGFPAVQVLAYRMLKRLPDEPWAADLLAQLYLDDETQKWADAGLPAGDEATAKTVDSNGTTLAAGDTVTLIKDLVVKGANFTAKRGTTVKNISLTDDPKFVEGRVNGIHIVLVAAYLKKA